MTAPGGIEQSDIGGGDCRRLSEYVAEPPSSAAAPSREILGDCGDKGLALAFAEVDSEGLRRCMERYDADDGLRGRPGLLGELAGELSNEAVFV